MTPEETNLLAESALHALGRDDPRKARELFGRAADAVVHLARHGEGRPAQHHPDLQSGDARDHDAVLCRGLG